SCSSRSTKMALEPSSWCSGRRSSAGSRKDAESARRPSGARPRLALLCTTEEEGHAQRGVEGEEGRSRGDGRAATPAEHLHVDSHPHMRGEPDLGAAAGTQQGPRDAVGAVVHVDLADAEGDEGGHPLVLLEDVVVEVIQGVLGLM